MCLWRLGLIIVRSVQPHFLNAPHVPWYTIMIWQVFFLAFFHINSIQALAKCTGWQVLSSSSYLFFRILELGPIFVWSVLLWVLFLLHPKLFDIQWWFDEVFLIFFSDQQRSSTSKMYRMASFVLFNLPFGLWTRWALG